MSAVIAGEEDLPYEELVSLIEIGAMFKTKTISILRARLGMLRISKHNHFWRVVPLIVLLVASMGPWFFDVIHVPSEYQCSPPFIRLDGDFCGTPMPGTIIFAFLAGGLIDMIDKLLVGQLVPTDLGRELLFSLSIFILLLPFISTLSLIRSEDSLRRQIFHMTAWGLAAGVGLLLGLPIYSTPSWELWGIWLFVGTAISSVIVEGNAGAGGSFAKGNNSLNVGQTAQSEERAACSLV